MSLGSAPGKVVVPVVSFMTFQSGDSHLILLLLIRELLVGLKGSTYPEVKSLTSGRRSEYVRLRLKTR